MERLTMEEVIEHCKRHTENFERFAFKGGRCNGKTELSRQYLEHKQVAEWLEELKVYHKLEKQGLLLELRCKVGDKAYHVIEDDVADPPIYISEHEIKDVSAKAVYFADDWWSFEEMDKANAFLSKEEAEKRRTEMERSDKKGINGGEE